MAESSNRRNDGQLRLMLHETANWTVIGRQGIILCEVASLRIAVDRWTELAARGLNVIALVRRRQPEIVVFSEQVRTLKNCLPEAEALPITVQAVKA